jgi:hypothetical protein
MSDSTESSYRQQLFVFVVEHDKKHNWMANEMLDRIRELPNVRNAAVFVSGNNGETLIISGLDPNLKEILEKSRGGVTS